MVSMSKIRELGQQIGREFHPDKVLLFGSNARRDHGSDSDIDLLVIMSTEIKPVYQAASIRASLHTDFPVDVIVRSPQRIQDLLDKRDAFTLEIMREGKVLYEASNR